MQVCTIIKTLLVMTVIIVTFLSVQWQTSYNGGLLSWHALGKFFLVNTLIDLTFDVNKM